MIPLSFFFRHGIWISPSHTLKFCPIHLSLGEDCEDSGSVSKWLGVVVISILVVIVLVAYCYSQRGDNQLAAFAARHHNTLTVSRDYLLMVYITWQIMVELNRVHVRNGGEPYPEGKGSRVLGKKPYCAES